MAGRSSHPKYSLFRFDAGSLALNFVTTVRHRGAVPRDLLMTPEALGEWFRLSGCDSPGAGVTSPTGQDLDEAVMLREAIYRTVKAVVFNENPMEEDIDRINTTAIYAPAVPQIEGPACRIRWQTDHPVRSCLAAIARDAVIIVGYPQRERLKMCDNQGCRMLFIDHSRANRRRWCAMSICGNREKIRMHRSRTKQAETA
jgi:predicted RNA-binding Zn ribbon-like protein